MKLKAVVHSDCPQELICALQNGIFRTAVLLRVLVPHLHVPTGFGPAEFYVQHCDLSDSEPFCEIRLTGISVTTGRSTDDFDQAAESLEKVCKGIIKTWLPKGQKCQLMVSIMLDQVPFGKETALIERNAIWVESKR